MVLNKKRPVIFINDREKVIVETSLVVICLIQATELKFWARTDHNSMESGVFHSASHVNATVGLMSTNL